MRAVIQRVKRASVRVHDDVPEEYQYPETGGSHSDTQCASGSGALATSVARMPSSSQGLSQVDVLAEPAGRLVGQIGSGLCVLIGITHGDGPEQVAKMARKIAQLKLLRAPCGSDDARDRVSVEDSGAPVLLVSQFTLYADVRKGRKPSWSHAAPAPVAEPLFDQLVQTLRAHGVEVHTGEFGAMMDVELVNDGPMTIIAEV
ncbi:D-aminoacyl-tRNA deacylase [Trueperella sp. LYQ143]|uniref:D-aminoacyl-tRNA deacylase n=1 Tax=Trueperella sp. LYQ143 TaxID=3391059 RepID=UPI0039833F44